MPDGPTDCVSALVSMSSNTDSKAATGATVHIYYTVCDCANRPVRRVLCYADGETLIVPPQGQLALATECGLLDSLPRDIAVAPRGVRCRVALPDGQARGQGSENHGPALRLPASGRSARTDWRSRGMSWHRRHGSRIATDRPK